MLVNEKNLKTALKQIKKQVEPIIQEIITLDAAKKFHPLFLYQIKTGGKRLRPALAVMSCDALGGRAKDVLYPAAGLEILHNYTLIVDDIIDHSAVRRNQPTVWRKHGISMADCASINLAASIFQTAQRCPYPIQISEILSKTIKQIAQGEILDILFERNGREKEAYVVKNRPEIISQAAYRRMIGQKTASLFEACCQIGAVCADGSSRQIKALKNYGFNLGLAFQIKDDVLDIFGEKKDFGKKIGKDIEERKGGNIVLLYALKELSKKDERIIQLIMEKKKITPKSVKEVMSLVKNTKARERCFKLGKRYINQAKKSLDVLPKSKPREFLSSLADFVIERNY